MYCGVVADDLPSPVVDGSELDDALLQLGDPRLGERPRMLAGLDGGVLGREPERVEPERGQDGLAVHRPVPDEEIAEGVVADVALVRRTARVRVHAKHVRRRARVVRVHLVGVLVGPALSASASLSVGRRMP